MKDKKTKTNHQTGYRKPVKNPTTNYPMDTHKAFCKRCKAINGNICPVTGKTFTAARCSV